MLAAGPLSVAFVFGELRYVRLGDAEVLQRIQFAVRDRNWMTLQAEVGGLRIDCDDRSFSIAYGMVFRGGDGEDAIDLAASARIIGDPSGRIRFDVVGNAGSTFLTNRTGFCVLHSCQEAGQACTIEHTDGAVERGVFPDHVSPHQPYIGIRAIRHRVQGACVRVMMEGEVFEMEDQRNWSDGSFKTYSRPLGMPWPYLLSKGEQIRQSVTIELLEPCPPRQNARSAKPIALELASPQRIPRIGLAVAKGFGQLSASSLVTLTKLRPHHLRIDIDVGNPDWDHSFLADVPALQSIDVPIEVALHVPENATPELLRRLASLWAESRLQAVRWLVLGQDRVTAPGQIALARCALTAVAPGALFAGGADSDFAAINRVRPPPDADAVYFSLSPQVHSFDNLSLIENLQSHRQVVSSARRIVNGRPVAVTPITLRRRFNPDATGSVAASSGLDSSLDSRQVSMFTAAWTVGCLSGLCLADYLTFYETHGCGGVIQGDLDPPLPALFPGRAGDVFCVYHVLRAALEFQPDQWQEARILRPMELAAIVLRKPGRNRLLLANLLSIVQTIHVPVPPGAALAVLDADSADAAARDPDFWSDAPTRVIGPSTPLTLTGYGIARIDWSAA